jgi:hypothetical protein
LIVVPTHRERRRLNALRRAQSEVEHLRACLESANAIPRLRRRAAVGRLRARLAEAEAALERLVLVASPNTINQQPWSKPLPKTPQSPA